MMMSELHEEVNRFVAESPLNRFPDGAEAYFSAPLLGVAAAADPLFTDYKTIIGPFHLTPQEVFDGTPQTAGARAVSVLSWVLPVTEATRISNRHETVWPSRSWSLTRAHGEKLNVALRRHLVAWLQERGEVAVAPQLSPCWAEYRETPVGIASTWSERHAAYAAGLGTFGLSDGLITPAGIAHRLGSVVTTLPLPPTPRTAPDHHFNCLYFREQRCGLCIGRCPVGAISGQGHDKEKCREYVYGTVPERLSESYGVQQTGCGLCQTRVPCEAVQPGRRSR